MKIASWNVNSLKVRALQVLRFLQKENPDVLVLQEIKQTDKAVDCELFASQGWNISIYGQETYNGVAIISKQEILNPVRGMGGIKVSEKLPYIVFASDSEAEPDTNQQARILRGDIGALTIVVVYVPNGQEVGSEKYSYKLNWLDALAVYLERLLAQTKNIVLLGDFNIAPQDIDIWNPKNWQGKILCSPPEREALERLLSLGFYDSFRREHPELQEFSWWDYRMNSFARNHGLRIDLALVTENLRAENTLIYKDYRSLERPSDHAPIGLEIRDI